METSMGRTVKIMSASKIPKLEGRCHQEPTTSQSRQRSHKRLLLTDEKVMAALLLFVPNHRLRAFH